MSSLKQRKALRKRKERNQKILWWIQDGVGALCLFGICYGMLFLPMLFGGE